MMSSGHGGDRVAAARRAGCRPEEILDFSVNVNPLGAPPGVFEVYFRAFDEAGRYPEPGAESAAAALAARWDIAPDRVLPGNGSSELLALLPRALGRKRAVIPVPGYLEYEAAARAAGLEICRFSLTPEREFELDPLALERVLRPGDLVLLGNPANPTGRRTELRALIERQPEVRFLVDEAFIEFAGEEFSLIGAGLPNLVVTRSFTKFYALPGLRLGCAVAEPELLARLRAIQPCWPLGAAETAVLKFLCEVPPAWGEESRRRVRRWREELAAGLRGRPGLRVYPSCANYLLVRAGDPELPDRLLREHRILVRRADNYPGLDAHYFRVAVRSAEENARLLAALPGAVHLPRARRTPALMWQGTSSNAGKSVLAAACCRVMLQDGFSVAPFKAQNMALNSYVTLDGGELGRAQAVQAEACRLEPDVRMNPILLKPQSDLGSQVVVRGRPVGTMTVREYFARKQELWSEVRSCYDRLSAEHEVMVLEGAGSPGEVNLKDSDLVNMRMARYAGASVLLTGDIDRGGVYAGFIGTYATFEPWERELLYGFVVNKFRGDPALLESAHRTVERFTGKPVLGVIDYQRDLGLPEEDSVNFSWIRPAPKLERTLDAVLIQLGHVANFTDFTPFELEPDVTVRKVSRAGEFGTPELVILPGSRSVAADLAELERCGLKERILAAAAAGAQLVGICGGLQLLGRVLRDPEHLESERGEVAGLGLLPLETVLRPQKILRRTSGVRPGGERIHGYEIHHGVSRLLGPGPGRQLAEDGTEIGYEQGNCFASYLHGVFDDDAFRRRWLDEVRVRRGLPPLGGVTARYGVEESLNRLAAHLRSRLDFPALYRRLGLR